MTREDFVQGKPFKSLHDVYQFDYRNEVIYRLGDETPLFDVRIVEKEGFHWTVFIFKKELTGFTFFADLIKIDA